MLQVKNGRLVNVEPNHQCGITKYAEQRKERKRQEKISMIEQAITRAETKEMLLESMLKK
jgi:hypothetical protein